MTFPTKKHGDIFVIKHYAGDVDYNSVNFMEKNVETLSTDLVNAMAASTDPIVTRLFAVPPPLIVDESETSSKQSVSSKSSSSA